MLVSPVTDVHATRVTRSKIVSEPVLKLVDLKPRHSPGSSLALTTDCPRQHRLGGMSETSGGPVRALGEGSGLRNSSLD